MAGCGDSGPKKAEGAKKGGTPSHLVEVIEVTSRPLAHETQRTGTLAARNLVRLFNQEEGRIESLAAREGDEVKAGQVLVRLDHRLLSAELQKAVAKRREAEGNLARIRELSKRNVATQERLDSAETALSVAKAEESLIRTRLDYAEIRAPFDGIVTERLKEPGDVAARNTHLMTVIDPKALYTEVTVSELMLPRLKVGGSADVRIDALGDGIYPARIGRIHPTIDPRTRQGVVEVELTPVPNGAAAGQLCRVGLRTAEAPRRVVPFAALRHDRKGTYVFLVGGDGKAAMREVRAGLRIGELVEILDGLADGDKVVIRGFLDLSAGKAVTVAGNDNASKRK